MKKLTDCWVYLGPFDFSPWSGKPYGRQGNCMVHRWSYETFKGPIPAGFTIDHLCKETLCVNPNHLEAVTLRENIRRGDCASSVNARKKFCIRGHPFISVRTGRRECYQCQRNQKKIYYRAHKTEKKAYSHKYYIKHRKEILAGKKAKEALAVYGEGKP